jgi:hypothetical protein
MHAPRKLFFRISSLFSVVLLSQCCCCILPLPVQTEPAILASVLQGSPLEPLLLAQNWLAGFASPVAGFFLP